MNDIKFEARNDHTVDQLWWPSLCRLVAIAVAKFSDRGGVEETRTQGSRPRPRTQKKSEVKDSLSEDKHSRGQGQECSRPRPRTISASALQKKKKIFTKIYHAISTIKRFPKNFSSAPQNFNNSKNSAVLEPRTGQFSRT